SQWVTVVFSVVLLSVRFGSGWLANTFAVSVRVPGWVGVATIDRVADEPAASVPASQFSVASVLPWPARVQVAPLVDRKVEAGGRWASRVTPVAVAGPRF